MCFLNLNIKEKCFELECVKCHKRLIFVIYFMQDTRTRMSGIVGTRSNMRNKQQTWCFLISSPRISGSRRHSSLAFAFIHRVEGHPKTWKRGALRGRGWTGNKAEVKEGGTSSRKEPTRERRKSEGKKGGRGEEWTSGENLSSRAPDLD